MRVWEFISLHALLTVTTFLTQCLHMPFKALIFLFNALLKLNVLDKIKYHKMSCLAFYNIMECIWFASVYRFAKVRLAHTFALSRFG